MFFCLRIPHAKSEKSGAQWHNTQKDVFIGSLVSQRLIEVVQETNPHTGIDRTTFKTTYEAQVQRVERGAMVKCASGVDANVDFTPRRDRRSGTHSKIGVLVSKLFRETGGLEFIGDPSKAYVKNVLQQHWSAISNATFNEFFGTVPKEVNESLDELWERVVVRE